MFKVGLYTLGCKVSQYETYALSEEFLRRGFEVCPFEEENDIYVVNTCTVTAESDRKSRQVIRRALKYNPKAIILVMGCYSQRSPLEVLKIKGVYAVIGTENKLSLVDKALQLLSLRDKGERLVPEAETTDVTKATFEKMCITQAPRTRAYVKIEDGCESKCTYCAISGARGRVRSKLPEDVISEVEYLSSHGVREIVLTGIETASYGRDFDYKYTLADLLLELDRRKSAERIRLGSLAPELINEEFVEKVSKLGILTPHFHLSIQSGSDSVLRRMKRRYNSKMAMSVIENIRKHMPRAEFTTDLMVGFPGESEEEFLESVDFVRRAGFLDAHIFAYSKREGTPAFDYPDQIPENIKQERSKRLINEKNKTRDAALSAMLDSKKTLSVIVETLGEDLYYTAHSDTYAEVRFPAKENFELHGEMLEVIPVSHKNGVIYAEIK